MEVIAINQILAIVTTNRAKVGGSAPIFYAENLDELEKVALYLSRIFMGAIHDLGNGVYIIVKH